MSLVVWIILRPVVIITVTVRASGRPPVHAFSADTIIAAYQSIILTVQVFFNCYLFHTVSYANRSCPVISSLIRIFGVLSATQSSGRLAFTKAAGICGHTIFPHFFTCSDLDIAFPSQS